MPPRSCSLCKHEEENVVELAGCFTATVQIICFDITDL